MEPLDSCRCLEAVVRVSFRVHDGGRTEGEQKVSKHDHFLGLFLFASVRCGLFPTNRGVPTRDDLEGSWRWCSVIGGTASCRSLGLICLIECIGALTGLVYVELYLYFVTVSLSTNPCGAPSNHCCEATWAGSGSWRRERGHASCGRCLDSSGGISVGSCSLCLLGLECPPRCRTLFAFLSAVEVCVPAPELEHVGESMSTARCGLHR
jgi:hypothetical protein